ncbi:MAG: Ribosomal RNA small subunit methyltransferase E [Deltaproteobacteria bacterium ADurb.Bin510]|nr:MAG: Ribosomal RNA small subunit methyltransferase E [Deltaproteobacteria bacterium ADurb.Bin510]
MPRFFAEIDGQRAVISGADAQHISGPLRIRMGEELSIRDGDQGYRARVVQLARNRIELEVLQREELVDRGARTVRLGLALISPKDMDEVVRLATELGVSEIQPVVMSRSNVRDLKAQRLERWQDIVFEALKQNQRRSLPAIKPVMSFADFVAVGAWTRPLVALPGAELKLNAVDDQDVGILIGPEGGFAAEEVERLLAAGFTPVSLGATVLRAVTAATAAVAILGM